MKALILPKKKFCRDHNHQWGDVERQCRAECKGWNAAIIAISKQLKEIERRQAKIDFGKDLIRTFPYEVKDKKLAEDNHSFNVASNLWKKHIRGKLREI